MRKFFGVSGALIVIIIVRVLVKDYFVKDLKKDFANSTAIKNEMKSAKNNKDSISVLLKYNIIEADALVDSIYNNNVDVDTSVVRLFEKGVERSVVDSVMKISYPYPIYKEYVDKIAIDVIKRNQNFAFKINNTSSKTDFAPCVKKSIGNIAEYTLVSQPNNNLLIYKDVKWERNTEYIFATNGAFCLQNNNGERNYGKWKCIKGNTFECYISKSKVKDTLYFDSEHNIINSKVSPHFIFN